MYVVAYYYTAMLMVVEVVMPAIAKVSPLYPTYVVRAAACSRLPWAGKGVAPAARGDGAGCWDLSTMGSWELDQWNGFPFSP